MISIRCLELDQEVYFAAPQTLNQILAKTPLNPPISYPIQYPTTPITAMAIHPPPLTSPKLPVAPETHIGIDGLDGAIGTELLLVAVIFADETAVVLVLALPHTI